MTQTWCSKCRSHYKTVHLIKWQGMTLPVCSHCRIAIKAKRRARA